MKEKTSGYSQSSYGGYQGQSGGYQSQGNPYGNQQGNPYGEWNPFEDILAILVDIIQMAVGSSNSQQPDMKKILI